MSKQAQQNSRSGNSTVEFALAASLILVPLLLFMVDAHRMYTLHNSLSHAAREGAIYASRGGSAQVAVEDSLNAAGVDVANLTLTVQSSQLESYGEEINVRLDYNAQGQLILPMDTVFAPLATASASAKME